MKRELFRDGRLSVLAKMVVYRNLRIGNTKGLQMALNVLTDQSDVESWQEDVGDSDSRAVRLIALAGLARSRPPPTPSGSTYPP